MHIKEYPSYKYRPRKKAKGAKGESAPAKGKGKSARAKQQHSPSTAALLSPNSRGVVKVSHTNNNIPASSRLKVKVVIDKKFKDNMKASKARNTQHAQARVPSSPSMALPNSPESACDVNYMDQSPSTSSRSDSPQSSQGEASTSTQLPRYSTHFMAQHMVETQSIAPAAAAQSFAQQPEPSTSAAANDRDNLADINMHDLVQMNLDWNSTMELMAADFNTDRNFNLDSLPQLPQAFTPQQLQLPTLQQLQPSQLLATPASNSEVQSPPAAVDPFIGSFDLGEYATPEVTEIIVDNDWMGFSRPQLLSAL